MKSQRFTNPWTFGPRRRETGRATGSYALVPVTKGNSPTLPALRLGHSYADKFFKYNIESNNTITNLK